MSFSLVDYMAPHYIRDMDNALNNGGTENTMQKVKITLGALCDGNLSIGDTREADIMLNGENIGGLGVHATHMSHSGLTSSGDRYTAGEVTACIWPRDFGVDGFTTLNNLGNEVEYLEHSVDMYRRHEQVLTAAQAKRMVREWVAETVTALLSVEAPAPAAKVEGCAVASFITKTKAENPGITKTAALRAFRAAGNSCRALRFNAVFASI